MNHLGKRTIPLLAATLLLAVPATAQRLSVTIGAQGPSYGITGSRGSIGVTYRSGGVSYRHGRRSAPRLTSPSCGVWIPGRHVTRHERTWVAGVKTKQWVPPVYQDHWQACGPYGQLQRVRVMTRAGYWQKVVQPGHYETRPVQVWVPGHWA